MTAPKAALLEDLAHHTRNGDSDPWHLAITMLGTEPTDHQLGVEAAVLREEGDETGAELLDRLLGLSPEDRRGVLMALDDAMDDGGQGYCPR